MHYQAALLLWLTAASPGRHLTKKAPAGSKRTRSETQMHWLTVLWSPCGHSALPSTPSPWHCGAVCQAGQPAARPQCRCSHSASASSPLPATDAPKYVSNIEFDIPRLPCTGARRGTQRPGFWRGQVQVSTVICRSRGSSPSGSSSGPQGLAVSGCSLAAEMVSAATRAQ